jgi:UDP-N-acetylmuramoylalanine--D-glutamate ligase
VVERDPLAPALLSELADRFGCSVEQRHELPSDAAVIVRSPGFLVPAAVAEAVPTTNPAALWLAERAHAGGRTVGITGTKGKSSSTTLLAHELRRRGVAVFLGGNVGTALWTRPPDDPDLVVAELSSYQAIEVDHSPELAAVTVLGEDHLDLHGSVAAYRDAKLNVVCGEARTAELAIVPEGAVGEVRARCSSVALRPVPAHPDVRVGNAGVVAELLVALGEEEVVDEALVARLVAAYPELPGRFQELPGPAGARRRWIDDALGSNPSALVAALHRARVEHGECRLVVIVGGRDDRHVSTAPILEAAASLPDVSFFCVDAFGERLAGALQAAGIDASTSPSLEAAVRSAHERTDGTPGTIVFSPGAPTPADQGSWKDRSQRFVRAVDELQAHAWR